MDFDGIDFPGSPLNPGGIDQPFSMFGRAGRNPALTTAAEEDTAPATTATRTTGSTPSAARAAGADPFTAVFGRARDRS